MKKEDYLFKDPSQESLDLKTKRGDPFMAIFLHEEIGRLQREGRLNHLFQRLEDAEIYRHSDFRARDNQFYRTFFREEQPKINMIVCHPDRMIVKYIAEEFCNKNWKAEVGWKKLQNAMVS